MEWFVHRVSRLCVSSSRKPLRAGFTLIELLIVISIMMVLVAMAATMLQPTEGRRIREAARAINVYLSSARNRAMETGRPCGVIFRNFNGGGFAMNADQCEVPPCYCGQLETSGARITNSGTITAALVDGNGTEEHLPLNMVRLGDLIQFNCQGPYYSITGSNGTISNGFLNNDTTSLTVALTDTTQTRNLPWVGTSALVPYRIFRSPMKGAATPLQLPATTVVDLQYSGLGAGVGLGATDFTVLFSPTGAVDCVYYGGTRGDALDMIYLLVGKRERVGNTYVAPSTANESDWANWQDLNNLWVTINPQTGVVSTEPIAAGAANAILARSIAEQAEGMGGR